MGCRCVAVAMALPRAGGRPFCVLWPAETPDCTLALEPRAGARALSSLERWPRGRRRPVPDRRPPASCPPVDGHWCERDGGTRVASVSAQPSRSSVVSCVRLVSVTVLCSGVSLDGGHFPCAVFSAQFAVSVCVSLCLCVCLCLCVLAWLSPDAMGSVRYAVAADEPVISMAHRSHRYSWPSAPDSPLAAAPPSAHLSSRCCSAFRAPLLPRRLSRSFPAAPRLTVPQPGRVAHLILSPRTADVCFFFCCRRVSSGTAAFCCVAEQVTGVGRDGRHFGGREKRWSLLADSRERGRLDYAETVGAVW